jgi:GNAT superfamily N-acetyltransferase
MEMRFVNLRAENFANLIPSCAWCVYWEFPQAFDGKISPEKGRAMKADWLREYGADAPVGGVALSGSEVCGFIQFGPAGLFPRRTEYDSGPVSDDALFITCLSVAPAHQGKGVARYLLEQAEQEAARQGFAALESFARRGSSNNPSGPLEMFVACGFEILRNGSEFPLVRKTAASVASR